MLLSVLSVNGGYMVYNSRHFSVWLAFYNFQKLNYIIFLAASVTMNKAKRNCFGLHCRRQRCDTPNLNYPERENGDSSSLSMKCLLCVRHCSGHFRKDDCRENSPIPKRVYNLDGFSCKRIIF